MVLSRGGTNKAEQRKAERTLKASYETAALTEQYEATTLGVPMKMYAEDYLKKNVRPVLDRLCKEQAKDPDDPRRRNSLRNRAEMEVRYQGHQDNIQQLRDSGARLVVASTHSDCSERCRRWQGRVYSLDGTSGTTDDGREYVPLEEATEVYKGRWKWGLLSYNCRHYLVAYRSGALPPRPNPATERREYAITQEQRRLERNVREWKTKALMYKGKADKKSYAFARKKAVEWNNAYIEFSRKNNRPIYPSRVRIV